MIQMNKELKSDLERVSRLPFREVEKRREVITEFHTHRTKICRHEDFAYWERCYAWLFVPLTLWPIDIYSLTKHILQCLLRGDRFEPKLLSLLRFVGSPPPERIQLAIVSYEHLIVKGTYEDFIRAQPKFDEIERELAAHGDLNAEWQLIRRSARAGGSSGAAGLPPIRAAAASARAAPSRPARWRRG